MKILVSPGLSHLLGTSFKRLMRYRLVLFIVLLALVYGYMLLTINKLSNAEPTEQMISLQANPVKSAKVDTKVIQQLRRLQDNSINVKTLFNEARDNPFQE